MLLRQALRTFEKRCLRPWGRTLTHALGGRRPRGDRVAQLEERVAKLESLVRELTGLAYLRLAEDDAAAEDHRTPA